MMFLVLCISWNNTSVFDNISTLLHLQPLLMFVLHILRLHVLFGSFKLIDNNDTFSIITLTQMC